MLFVDCTEWCKKHGKTIEDVEKADYRTYGKYGYYNRYYKHKHTAEKK